jgi:hypothetical protein
VDKPPSPSARKTFLETPNPTGSEDINVRTGAVSNPTSPSTADLKHDAAHQSLRLDPTKRQEASPLSPKSFGLGSHGGPQPGEGSSVPRHEKQPRQYSRVAEPLWDNANFIRVGFHIGRYVSASVNTQAEQEQIKALYSSMKTTSELIDESSYASLYLLTSRFNPFLMQAVVKHSQDKDQFLRVSHKRMQETQMYENELKEANENISTLFARLHELEAKCTEENQLKEGKLWLPFYLIILSYPSILWIDHDFILQSKKDQLTTLGITLGAPGSEAKAFIDLKVGLDNEKFARVVAHIEADVLSRAVRDLKVSTDRFATQVPTLEDKVRHLEDKVVEGLKEVRVWELCLECTTQANDEYQKDVA